MMMSYKITASLLIIVVAVYPVSVVYEIMF